MGISISIHNQVHEKVETIAGVTAATLPSIVDSASPGSLIEGIHLYADTMFNSYQLKYLLQELTALNPTTDSERMVVSEVRRAAETAISQQGYLWFSGD
ncbi:hypothetical protein [Nocardia huaxiensis]|uniref:hypothetical protein n=1 Tax=Nocardia huaxiensis TaxID=2755382 RepID=UPI001E2B006C|nr:hypothetical protein [Nocardia huaxiensis]UFS99123.1 hypothetical protein LPY97_15090 [Nocardia huaxiensis]